MATTQPSSIGRYEIISLLGEGGMGAVFLGRDPLIERQIAVKFLRDGLENDELRERFVREARSAGRLQHVNIVVIFDVGEQAGRPFIAMEYVEGSTIADMVRRRDSIPLPQKLRLLEQLSEGLAYAHRAGIVHRDIKPANLIVSRDGVLKILDFGIARLGRAGLTMAGVMLGTLNYMSPEQITGTEVDRRSDIFAVGAVCYEFLSNTRAFPGDLQDGILHRILTNHPPGLAGLCPGIDPRVVDIVNKALEKDPSRRYQDLESLHADLVAVRESLGPLTGPGQAGAFAGGSLPDSGPHVPPTVRRTMTGREQATKFRAEQIGHWIESANGALARGAYDEVLKACQQVFVLDPDNAAAVDLSDRAKAATDGRQISEHLEQATELLGRGALDDASRIVKLALALDPASPTAIRTRLAIDEARRAREQEAARRQSIDAAMDGAEAAFSSSSYDSALRKLDEVLSLDRGHAKARTLRDEVLDAIERRRRLKDLEEQVRATVTEAWDLYGRGDCEAAFAILEEANPPHPLIINALGELRNLQNAAQRTAHGGTDSEKTQVVPIPSALRQGPATSVSDARPTMVGQAPATSPKLAFDLDSTVFVPHLPPPRSEPTDERAGQTDTSGRSRPPTGAGHVRPPETTPSTGRSSTTGVTARRVPEPPTSQTPPATDRVVPDRGVATPPTTPEPRRDESSATPVAPPIGASPASGVKKYGVIVGVGVVLVVALASGAAFLWKRSQATVPVNGQGPSAVQAQPATDPAGTQTLQGTNVSALVPQPGETPVAVPSVTPGAAAGPAALPAGGPTQALPLTPNAGTPGSPSTQTPRRRTPAAGPAAVVVPQPSQQAPTPQPAEPAPTRGTLVVESDTPGARVFVDDQSLGAAPIRSTALSPGEHQLRATLDGEDDITRMIDIGTSGETTVVLRFKEPRLRTAVQVVHKHGGGGSCEGKLSATLAGLTYDTPNRNDAFSLTFAELERFQIDLPTKTMTVKRYGGRTWNFTDRNASPVDLQRFHTQVTKAREKMAGQGR